MVIPLRYIVNEDETKVDYRIEPRPFKTDDFNSSNPFVNEIKKGIKIM